MLKRTLKLKPRPLVGSVLLAMSLMANAGITLTTSADTKLGEVISTIQAQSDYKFFYDDNLYPKNWYFWIIDIITYARKYVISIDHWIER